MKKKIVFGLLGTFVSTLLVAQQPQSQQAASAPSQTSQSISASLGLHAFPARDQTPQQRQSDESACYNWAKQDSGFDPIAAGTNQAASASYAAPKALGAKGAAAGAGGGAAIGAIAGDAGKGAVIGAAAGGMRGRMAERLAQAQAQQQAQAKGQAQKSGLENFKRAFSACMEAKGYSLR